MGAPLSIDNACRIFCCVLAAAALLISQLMLVRQLRGFPVLSTRCFLAVNFAGWAALAAGILWRGEFPVIAMLAVVFAPLAAVALALSLRQLRRALLLAAASALLLGSLGALYYLGSPISCSNSWTLKEC
jgi:hypothetical protein